MPLCPTGYALASFRPHPISDSSLGTAEMLKPFKKEKLKKKESISAICFSINLHLGMWRFLPIKIYKQKSTGGNLPPGQNAGLYVKY